MPFKTRVPWRDKIANSPAPKLVDVAQGTSRWGSGKMLISSPAKVEEKLCSIPKGSVITTKQLRESLAKEAKADFTCPLTTGIFLKIVSHAAEDERETAKTVTPYWRVVKEKGELNASFPGGIERQAMLLEQDGVKVEQIGKKLFVRAV